VNARVYDRNQPVRELSPSILADQRAEQLYEATEDDKTHFMLWYQRGRSATLQNDERVYGWFREALDDDDSVAVAGLIEGITSTRSKGLVF
jgi:hypothetical protein